MSDDEFFDGIPVSPSERGESFGLSPTCYRRMAQAALRCMHYAGVEPVLIRRLRGGRGAELVLYGNLNVYTLRVDPSSAPAKVSLNYLPLDSNLGGPGCELCIAYDEPQAWLHICDMMIFREGSAGSEELVE